MFRKTLAISVLVAFIIMPLRGYAAVLPTDTSDNIGGTIVGGTGSFSLSGNTLNVNPTSSRFISEHNDFSIGSGYTVQYNQGSASDIAVARVVTANPSNIFGHLGAVGKVFLINPNGIIFQPGSSVDTAGLIASSLPMTTSDADFLKTTTTTFNFAGSGGAVVNAGVINTPGSFAALLGTAVENSVGGSITANTGTIELAGGKAMTVSLDPTGFVKVVVSVTGQATTSVGKTDQVVNAGTLTANGGIVILDAKSLAGLFRNSVNHSGAIEAGEIDISGDGDIVLSGGSITATSTEDRIQEMEDQINTLTGTALGRVDLYPADGFTCGSVVSIFSQNGNVTLGNASADFIFVDAAGGAVSRGSGELNAQLAYLMARNDIGAMADPIITDVDYIAGDSFGTGNIFIKENGSLTVGFYLPFTQSDSDIPPNLNRFAFGMSLAAADGTVSVISAGDMTVDSIVAPRGGVYLQSTSGSIYAGKGWFSNYTLDPLVLGFEAALSPYAMDVSDTSWSTTFGFNTFYPVSVSSPDLLAAYKENGPNVTAGGYSYFSSLKGTIGTGTPSSNDPAMSGNIMGVVIPGVTAATGVNPSFDFDPIYGMPAGYVQYMDLLKSSYPPDYSADPQQVWLADAKAGLSFENPLFVIANLVKPAGDVSNAAVRDGFTPVAALTLQFGTPLPPPGPVPAPEGSDTGSSFGGLNPTLRAYYEILSKFRFVSFEPIVPTTYLGYHPITHTDMAAFDGITLDEGFYSFIDNKINLKNSLNTYFGEEDTNAKKKN